VALDVIRHKSDDELIEHVKKIVAAKKISEIFVGLPKLPQGGEGEQANHTRSIGQKIEKETKLQVTFIDERYSSLGGAHGSDSDAKAACEILSVALDQRKIGY
jgi:putative transcription antitermination factor YqgF